MQHGKGRAMSIEFHCEHCGKTVRTGSENAGKRGKCPHCQNSVYIPTPSEELEPLPIAPLDESGDQRQQELLEESRNLARRILHEKDVPHESHAPAGPRSDSLGDARLLAANMEGLIIEYALCMAQGKLAEAAELAAEIRTNMKVAEEVMLNITRDEVPPPQLAKIPRPVLVGFFKQLREKK